MNHRPIERTSSIFLLYLVHTNHNVLNVTNHNVLNVHQSQRFKCEPIKVFKMCTFKF